MPELPDHFLFEVDGLTPTLRVARFAGQEAMSELYRFEIWVTTDDPAISFDQVVGKTALLTLVGPDDPRFVHGVVLRFEQLDLGKKRAAYHVVLGPKATELDLRADIRIFQELTAPDILAKVFQGAGLVSGDDFRLSLQATYRPREYCVQFRETDLAFATRLMEEEGIYYYYEHESAKHTMVLSDKPPHPKIPAPDTVIFRPPTGAINAGEHVHRFHYAEQIRSGKSTLRDYNFKKPSLSLEATSSGTTWDKFEVYDYPGGHEVPADGTAIAKLRIEERRALLKTAEGESGIGRMIPGHTFTMSEHQRDTYNRDWLLLRVDHRGVEPLMSEVADSEETRYECRFECVPSDIPFRPPIVTPKPSVRGVQSAIVVGPAGEEIYTDEHGRVKVQFHWDRLGKKDDKSSCWIRVSQVWAGEAWGAMHIPRIKQEVLVDFLDGDPDRPIIIGRVYHGTNVPPYALPANKTRSTIKSNSTPGGGGSNELCFEDKKGNEEVYLHGQKDWTIAIEHDKNQTVGHDETRKIGNDRTLETGHDQKETIKNDETFEVAHDRKKTVKNDEAETIGNDRTIEVGKDHTEAIGGNMSLTVTGDKSEEVTGESKETVSKNKAISISQKLDVEIGSSMSTKVGASQTEEIEVDKTVKVGSKIVLECGDVNVTIEKNGNVTVKAKKLELTVDGDVKVTGKKIEVTSDGEVKVEASGKVSVKGSGPMDLNASGPVKVKGSNVDIN